MKQRSVRIPPLIATLTALLVFVVAFRFQPVVSVDTKHGDSTENNSPTVLKKEEGLSFLSKILSITSGSGEGKNVWPQKEFLVLGAGMSRTGTKSTKAALTYLGYKVFHSEDMFELGMQKDFQYAFYSEHMLDRLINKILALGFNATLDVPSNGLVFRIAQRFPKAKILYTVRDTPEQWAASFLTIVRCMRQLDTPPVNFFTEWQWLNPAGWDYMFGMIYESLPCAPGEFPLLEKIPWFDCKSPTRITMSLDDFAKSYVSWDKKVKEAYASGRANKFLEFNVKQGWGPLTRFLQVAEPPATVPFPKTNESETLEIIERVLLVVGVVWPFMFAPFVLLFLWLCEQLMGAVRTIWAVVCCRSRARKQ